MPRTVVALALACALVLAGSHRLAAAAALPPAMLGVTWDLVTLQAAGQVVENTSGTGLTIMFAADGTVSGSGGCNQFTGTYQVFDEGQLAFSPLASTRRACADPAVDARETRYFATLQEVAGFVLASPASMRLTFEHQGLQLVYQRGAPSLPATGGGGMASSTGTAWSSLGVVAVGLLIAIQLLRGSRRIWRSVTAERRAAWPRRRKSRTE